MSRHELNDLVSWLVAGSLGGRSFNSLFGDYTSVLQSVLVLKFRSRLFSLMKKKQNRIPSIL